MQPQTNKLATYLSGFYIAKSAEGVSPNTIIEYKKDFAHFVRWCEAEGKADPIKLKPAEIREFLAHLRTQPNGRGGMLAPKTVRNVWVALKSFNAWAMAELSAPDIMKGVAVPKAPEPLVEPLNREQIAAVLRAAESTRQANTQRRGPFAMRRSTAVRDKALILTFLDGGLRSSELCDLRLEHLDLATGRIIIHLTAVIATKPSTLQ